MVAFDNFNVNLYKILFSFCIMMNEMESTYYLFPGQTLENTKVSDRFRALHMTQTAWDGIKRHLDRKKILQEAVDREAAVKKYLKDGSRNMTQSWENSLENVRKRKEKERLEEIEQRKEERQRKFLQLRKEQEEIRKAYMEKVKKQIFMTTGHARHLTSALITSEVLFERQKQQEFKEKIKQHEKDEELIYAETQKKKAEKEAAAEKEKKKKAIEREKKHFQELKFRVEQKKSLEKCKREEIIKKEAIDNIEAIKEEQKLEKMVIQDKLRKKKELFEDRNKYLLKQKEREAQMIKEQKELDEIVEIYTDTKHAIDCMRKEREKELRDNAIKRREKIAKMVMAEKMDKSAQEERNLKKAIQEKEAAELEKIKRRQEYEQKLKQEKIKNHQEVLAKEKEQKIKEEEYKKWQMINRYKADEHMKIYEQKKKHKLWQEIINYRQILCEQINENKTEALKEKMLEEAFTKSTVEHEDGRFFQYANEVLELAKRKGRSTVPIEKVITQYIKETNLNSEALKNIYDKNNACKKLKKLCKKKQVSKPCKCVYSNNKKI